MSVLCTKDFTMTVKPDPTFQGVLWASHVGTATLGASLAFTGNKERFSFAGSCPNPSGVLIADATGADGTLGGLITIPAVPQQRNCIFHLESFNFTGNYSAGDSGLVLTWNQVAPPVAHNQSFSGAVGSTDFAFVLAAGKAFNFSLQMNMHIFASAGLGQQASLTWTGFLYVQTYS